MIAYRIQQPEHSIEMLLATETQFSTSWCDEDDVRSGVSACMSVEDLAEYFAQVGIPLSPDCLLVTMECEPSREADSDAHLGAHLVYPAAIIATELAGERFLDIVGDAYDRI